MNVVVNGQTYEPLEGMRVILDHLIGGGQRGAIDGKKLREMRKRQKLSAPKVADALNVSRQAIYQWELNTSDPSATHLAQLCRLYRCGIEEISN